jgi:hypothetical protein
MVKEHIFMLLGAGQLEDALALCRYKEVADRNTSEFNTKVAQNLTMFNYWRRLEEQQKSPLEVASVARTRISTNLREVVSTEMVEPPTAAGYNVVQMFPLKPTAKNPAYGTFFTEVSVLTALSNRVKKLAENLSVAQLIELCAAVEMAKTKEKKKFRLPKNATNLVCESTKVALVDGCPTFVFKLVPDGGGRARIREISLPITPRVFEAMKDFQANHIFFSNDEAFSVLVKNIQNHGIN